MGHGPHRHTPPLELRFVRTPTEVKHLTAAEFYRSLIRTRNKKMKLHFVFCFLTAPGWYLRACAFNQRVRQKKKLFLDVLFGL